MQRSALCRSRRELSKAYLLAKFGFDTAENEPSRVCRIPGQQSWLQLEPRRRLPEWRTEPAGPERARPPPSSRRGAAACSDTARGTLEQGRAQFTVGSYFLCGAQHGLAGARFSSPLPKSLGKLPPSFPRAADSVADHIAVSSVTLYAKN